MSIPLPNSRSPQVKPLIKKNLEMLYIHSLCKSRKFHKTKKIFFSQHQKEKYLPAKMSTKFGASMVCISIGDKLSSIMFPLKGAPAKTRLPETLTNADFELLESKSNLFFDNISVFWKKILNSYKAHFSQMSKKIINYLPFFQYAQKGRIEQTKKNTAKCLFFLLLNSHEK